jgi:hypothetical protein
MDKLGVEMKRLAFCALATLFGATLFAAPVNSSLSEDFLRLEKQLRSIMSEKREIDWKLYAVKSDLHSQDLVDFLVLRAPLQIDIGTVDRIRRQNLTNPTALLTLNIVDEILSYSQKKPSGDSIDIYSFRYQSPSDPQCNFSYDQLWVAANAYLGTFMAPQSGLRCLLQASEALVHFLDSNAKQSTLQAWIRSKLPTLKDRLISEDEFKRIFEIKGKVSKKNESYNSGKQQQIWNEEVRLKPEEFLEKSRLFYRNLGFDSSTIKSPEILRNDIPYRGKTGVVNWPTDIRWAVISTSPGDPENWGTLVHEMGHVVHAMNIREPRLINQDFPSRPIAELFGVLFGTLAWAPEVLQPVLGLSDSTLAALKVSGLLFSKTQIYRQLFQMDAAYLINYQFSHPDQTFQQGSLNGMLAIYKIYFGADYGPGDLVTNDLTFEQYSALYAVINAKTLLKENLVWNDYLRSTVLVANILQQEFGTSMITQKKLKSLGDKIKSIFQLGATATEHDVVSVFKLESSFDDRLKSFAKYIDEHISHDD